MVLIADVGVVVTGQLESVGGHWPFAFQRTTPKLNNDIGNRGRWLGKTTPPFAFVNPLTDGYRADTAPPNSSFHLAGVGPGTATFEMRLPTWNELEMVYAWHMGQSGTTAPFPPQRYSCIINFVKLRKDWKAQEKAKLGGWAMRVHTSALGSAGAVGSGPLQCKFTAYKRLAEDVRRNTMKFDMTVLGEPIFQGKVMVTKTVDMTSTVSRMVDITYDLKKEVTMNAAPGGES